MRIFTLWKGPLPSQNGTLDRVAHVLIRHGFPSTSRHLKVNLVHVKGMGFKGAILDRPIFNGSDLGSDDGLFVRLKNSSAFVRPP